MLHFCAVYSFIELVPFLLSLEGAKFILSERFNQDNVELFFGKQRARCGRGDKVSVYSRRLKFQLLENRY